MEKFKEFAQSKWGQFAIGLVVFGAYAVYVNVRGPDPDQLVYEAVQVGTAVTFEAQPGERIAVQLKSKNNQDLKYSVTAPDGSVVYEKGDPTPQKHRRFVVDADQSGTYTLQLDYDCTNCKTGIGYTTADVMRLG